MKVTVCELPNQQDGLEESWGELCRHVDEYDSSLVLLPEMPFYPWLANSRDVIPDEWKQAVQAHQEWITRLGDLAPATVLSTRPTLKQDIPHNVGYIWDRQSGLVDVHTKYYLPDEPGYWEATWYRRGKMEFESIQASGAGIGFLICTEIWFNQHAREYSKQGVQLLVCPRATPRSTANKWVAGGQASAVVSGAYCLSSNLAGKTPEGGDFAGLGWVIDPDGSVLGLTSPEKPFLTLDIDLSESDKAKRTYPRYVLD